MHQVVFAQVQTWTQVSSLPASTNARNHPVTFSIGQFGYLLTGYDGNFLLGDFYQYNPVSDSWTTKANFPGGPRGFAYGVEHNGKGYVGFGIGVVSNTVVYYNDLWEYDPTTDNWTKLADCPADGRRHPAFLAANNKLYLGCGDNQNGNNLRDWWEYDIQTNTWTQKPDLPAPPRHHPYFFTINDEPYVGFGHNGNAIYKDLFRYNPATSSWIKMADLPAQGRVAGTQFTYNNKGYLLSGQGEDHLNMATGEFWEYDPQTNSWTSLPPHPGGSRWAPGSFVIGNTVYFTCGESGFTTLTNLKDMWKYEFPSFPANVEAFDKSEIKIYPNPAHDAIQISATNNIEAIEIFTLTGVRIQADLQKLDSRTWNLDTRSYSNGNYLARLINDKGNMTMRFSVQH